MGNDKGSESLILFYGTPMEFLKESLKGSLEGSLIGSLKGTLKGSLKGSLMGSLERSLNGCLNDSLKGCIDCSLIGYLEYYLNGYLEGSLERFLNGYIEGLCIDPPIVDLRFYLNGILWEIIGEFLKESPIEFLKGSFLWVFKGMKENGEGVKGGDGARE